jgi:hypothetical protein
VSRAIKWAIGLAVVLIALFAFCRGPRSAAPTPPNVDSLQTVNADLAHQNDKLKVDLAQLTVERNDLKVWHDSVKTISDSATNVIRGNRAKLPAAAAVPDSALRTSYAAGLQQLDAALAELGRKEMIIRRDELAQIKSDSIEADLRQLLASTEEQYQNERKISKAWKQDYEKEYAENHRLKCGRKCGIVIGVVGTVAGAIGVQKVVEVFDARRPD